MKEKSAYISLTLLGIAIIGLFVSKYTLLNLPHYWDEAFPYSYAIGHMTENGASILSDGAPSIYTTGHPLLYYFCQSIWNSIAGGELWIERLFPMIISSFVLLFTFLIGKHLHSDLSGGIAALLLSTQNAFIAQASFQLPETMLTLFLLMTIYFGIKEKKCAFILSATGLVFTKEAGVILLFLVFVYYVASRLKKTNLKELLVSSWIFVIPIALNFGFYLHQYFVQGWFLFPRHTGFIETEGGFVVNQFSRYFAHLFINSGRNILFFTMLLFTIISILLRVKSRKKIAPKPKLFLIIGLIVGFLIFSAFNFYSDRYILCLFPLFILLVAFSVITLFKEKIWLSSAIGVSLCCITFFVGFTKRTPTDHSLGYSDAIQSQKYAINYCVESGWKDQPIQTSFLMSKNLTSHYPRYLEKDDVFTNVNQSDDAEIIIISSNEQEEHLTDKIKNYHSVKRFESGSEWCEIYVEN